MSLGRRSTSSRTAFPTRPLRAGASISSESRAAPSSSPWACVSPDKGIEYVIDALPSIAERFPEVLYIVLGATHPQVKERARRELPPEPGTESRATRRRGNLIFHDRFVSQSELVEFLAAADIYVTPYPQPNKRRQGPWPMP